MSRVGVYMVSLALIGTASDLVVSVGASDVKKISFGKHLSSECTSCHRIDGVDNGIPSITGWDVSEFVQTMTWYKEGTRDNPAMKSVAESLDEQQIEALSAYFATLPKPPKKR